jgi:hypothetical protein
MMKRHLAMPLLALMFALPAMAVAGELPALPVPRITDAPNRMQEGPSRMVHYSFTATPRTASGNGLDYYAEQWYCPPGKDNPPVGGVLPSPWAGQQASCALEKNHGGASESSSPTITSGSMMFPVQGGKSLTPGTWYLRVRLRWTDHAGTVVKEGGWSAWHRTLVVAAHANTQSYTGTFAGTKTARADHSHVNTINMAAKMAERSKPPVIKAPMEGRVYHGGPINFSGSLAPHKTTGGDWACCSIQWKRAVILAPENKAYAQAHTPGKTAFPSPPMPWQGDGVVPYGLASNVKESGPSFNGHFLYSDLRPHDGSFGYRYWFRLREYFYPDGLANMMKATIYTGPWSAWRSFTVQEPNISRVMPSGSMRMQPGAHMTAPSSGQQHGQQQNNSRQSAPSAPAGMHRTQPNGQQQNSRRLAPMPMMQVR